MSLPLPEQPSRNRSASTGDSGLPKHEHKRPRLSQGQEKSQHAPTVSTVDENNSSSLQTPASTSSPSSRVIVTPPPQSLLPTDGKPDATSPQSKVTINTRPISSHSSAVGAQSQPTDNSMEPSNPEPLNGIIHHPSVTLERDEQQTAISISSSEAGSPIIQIAVPEDLDQDPDDTQWEPISNFGSHRSSVHPGHIRRTFPYLERATNGQEQAIILQVAKVISEGTGNDEDVFQKVKAWMVEFADNANDLTYEYFEEDNDLWQKIPILTAGLLKRRAEFHADFQIDDLVEFFVAYIRISALIAEADVAKLHSQIDVPNARNVASPHSPSFLGQSHWIITAEGVPVYESLRASLNYSPTVVTEMIMDRLLDSHAVRYIRSLISLYQAMAEFFPRRGMFLDSSLNLVLFAGEFVHTLAERAYAVSTEPAGASDGSVALLSVASEFIQTINATLDRAITKQQPWLNIETCEKVFKMLDPFVTAITARFPQLAMDLIVAANVKPSSFNDAILTYLASTAWRFTTLQKFIKKGRMEVRVACVQIMAQELVEVYHEHIRTTYRNLEHPKIQFIVQFMRENDIIRYMIGVDSHPQIIERCANIIGFLCVSRSYRNEDTDVIWQTVLESQDPRAIVALLGVFQQNFEHLDIGTLCYICRKLYSVPFERYDLHMLDFVTKLLAILTSKSVRDPITVQDEIEANECSIQFCVKMLREACVPGHICLELSVRLRSQIQQTLGTRIRCMKGQLKIGHDADLMKPILTELCNHIASHNDFASGSSFALGTILQEADDDECNRVVQEHNMASLLIDDIAHLCEGDLTSVPRESTWPGFESRIWLLMKLIQRTSDEITESLLDRLWEHVLSASKLNPQLRSMAWASLANIFENCRLRNQVLDCLVAKYLPTLAPSLYDSAISDFVKNSVKYDMRHTPLELMEPQDIVTIPGIERMWNVMLTAPPNSIELDASQFIIEQYLDGDRVSKRELSSIEATHLALIDRSVRQVIDAAGHLKPNLDTEMVDETKALRGDTQAGFDAQAIRFHRSLLFLREFLDNLKTRPRFTPAVTDNLKKTLSTFEKKGLLFQVTLQVIGHKTLAAVQTKWTLGYDNSGIEVYQFLFELTGWSQFVVISGGKRVQMKDEQNSMRDLGITTGSLIISKLQGSPESTPARAIRASSPVDNKVMRHFDDLYNLLELEDQFAREVFDFLRMFSSQEGVVQRLKSMTIAPDQLLPVEKPFKLLYYARTLRTCIEDESFSTEPNTDFLVYGIRTIIAVLPNLNKLNAELTTCISIAQSLVEALTLGLRARVPIEVSKTYFVGTSFAHEILALWTKALNVCASEPNQHSTASLVRAPFEALVEGLLHDEQLWPALSKDDFVLCLSRSLLLQPTQEIRRAILEVVYSLTGVTKPKSSIKSGETRAPRIRFANAIIENQLGNLWTSLLEIIGQADGAAETCEEYFDALESILREYQPKLVEDDLRAHIESWKSLIIAHRYTDNVGLAPHDFFIASLGRLLLQAAKALRVHHSLSGHEPFIRQLFSLFLFPPLTESTRFGENVRNLQHREIDPVLDMHTRWVLYELILILGQDKNSLEAICDELNSDLVPKDFYFQPTTNNDRQSLRSETGYSGLRNLSNTCYLNSLLSQLFMNVEFRELIMNVNIIDGSKQKLVYELGKVFAYMQASYEEAINPESAIDAITLWEGEQIDVTVQMDVDEFFNILFDRLESQIVDPKVCSVFKRIYGGQLVQQIKSRECEHVSERLEPFAAVQVEIKGKASLEESLRAYVEGEVLQGENKYSCTSCGKHVDAVKRACLKAVPDHLIFNLKRFDYDIMTGIRCKVNDEFGFPDLIDMTPYTLEALSKPGDTIQPDIFELVGIIIHSGTAESGHYYSYIRQRPSVAPKESSWVQFNDHDVTKFDPSSIKECCFGGIDYGAIQCPKFYNGYMLFYQRSTSLQEFQRKYLGHDQLSSVRLPVAPTLERYIAQHNELFLRSYVAQDPIHAKFMKMLLQQKQTNSQLHCTEKHEDITSKLLTVTLDYINQLSARWKDLPEFDETMSLLRAYTRECDDCAKEVIDWLMTDDNLIDNLVRSCYVSVRKSFAHLISDAWSKRAATVRSRQSSEDSSSAAEIQEYSKSLGKFLFTMANRWNHLQRHGRAWENFFAILTTFLQMGEHEGRLVIQAGFLELTLELVHVHVPSLGASKRLRPKYSAYLLQRDRNRPFAHSALIQMLADLLPHVDLLAPVTEYQPRAVHDNQIGLTLQEASLLGLVGQQQIPFNWLRKVIFGRNNPPVANSIVEYLCKFKDFDEALSGLLKEGMADRNLLSTTACLQPLITFISNCSDQPIVLDTVEDALASIETTNGQYSKDFLLFVQQVLQVSNSVASIPRGGLQNTVKKFIPTWAPVLLMAPNELHADVRGDTSELLQEILFNEMEVMETADPRRYRQDVNICRKLAQSCAVHAEAAFIHVRTPTIQPGQAHQACNIVNYCLSFYGETAGDEEDAARYSGIMDEFRARSEGVVETTTEPDWNASSDLEALSEVDNMSDASN